MTADYSNSYVYYDTGIFFNPYCYPLAKKKISKYHYESFEIEFVIYGNINKLEQTNTIVGIATATGKAGVSIIRISGSKALASVQKVFYPSKPSQIKSNPIKTNQIKSHKFYYGWIKHRAEWIDEVLLVFMKAPHSYTKEDVVEIHSHGGVLITNRMLEILLSLGLKLAEKGEFTKRAFLNGRIDLTKAEAIGQLVQANSLASLSQAVNQLQGKLFEKITLLEKKFRGYYRSLTHRLILLKRMFFLPT